jgi:ferredoxin
LLTFRSELCLACEACRLACTARKLGYFAPQQALMRIEARFRATDRSVRAFVCDRCGECARMCPETAITMIPGPRVDLAACTACGACGPVCPQGIVRFDPPGKPRICDDCDGEPACADWCPVGALTWEGART